MVTNRWVHCPKCGHRMFFIRNADFDIEIKCTSCKAIVNLNTHNISDTVYRKMPEGTAPVRKGGKYNV